jgi:hypothetical protein
MVGQGQAPSRAQAIPNAKGRTWGHGVNAAAAKTHPRGRFRGVDDRRSTPSMARMLTPTRSGAAGNVALTSDVLRRRFMGRTLFADGP